MSKKNINKLLGGADFSRRTNLTKSEEELISNEQMLMRDNFEPNMTPAEKKRIENRALLFHRRQKSKKKALAKKIDKQKEYMEELKKSTYILLDVSRGSIQRMLNEKLKEGFDYVDSINRGNECYLVLKRLPVEDGHKTSFVENLINLGSGPGVLKKTKKKRKTKSKSK